MNVDSGYTPTVEESVLPKMIKPIDASDSDQPSLSPPHHSPLSAASPTRFPLPPLTLKPLARSVSNPVITASSSAHRMSLVPRLPLRKGKWTPEEEMYAHYIIDNFNKGLISLTRGTTLRSYLSERLNCDPMRVTKKFSGTSCIGKSIFCPCEATPDNLEASKRVSSRLAELEAAFKSKVDAPSVFHLPRHPAAPPTQPSGRRQSPAGNGLPPASVRATGSELPRRASSSSLDGSGKGTETNITDPSLAFLPAHAPGLLNGSGQAGPGQIAPLEPSPSPPEGSHCLPPPLPPGRTKARQHLQPFRPPPSPPGFASFEMPSRHSAPDLSLAVYGSEEEEEDEEEEGASLLLSSSPRGAGRSGRAWEGGEPRRRYTSGRRLGPRHGLAHLEGRGKRGRNYPEFGWSNDGEGGRRPIPCLTDDHAAGDLLVNFFASVHRNHGGDGEGGAGPSPPGGGKGGTGERGGEEKGNGRVLDGNTLPPDPLSVSRTADSLSVAATGTAALAAASTSAAEEEATTAPGGGFCRKSEESSSAAASPLTPFSLSGAHPSPASSTSASLPSLSPPEAVPGYQGGGYSVADAPGMEPTSTVKREGEACGLAMREEKSGEGERQTPAALVWGQEGGKAGEREGFEAGLLDREEGPADPAKRQKMINSC
ncbi:hypothetical protein NSK_000247 [Nannochloropsis salina CCMP1776]|uniref:Uncharacterized protein n=1 Tax=Nannochloropsis salina CCMP1776 TaxID=1027361 RepID=A0A4D9DIA2_9STRA|nr:hypothetical protein NSK_000247 [Nannochloropsis salina CCMP1776]|eukprot:TFJ88678.1 hypothetical protein NSK_000247 [Nannochloropsis salina CCMP1776]